MTKKNRRYVGIDIPVYAERHQVLITEPVEPMQGPMFMGFSLNIYAQQTPPWVIYYRKRGSNRA